MTVREKERHPAVAYVAPFATFMLFVALAHWLPVSLAFLYPVRVVVVATVLVGCSRHLISFHAGNWAGSILMGIVVFVLWIAPDVLWPAYRSRWLFDNFLVGSAQSSVPHDVKGNLFFVALRVFGSVVLVPFLEEFFWRGWLMRWLVHPEDFQSVRLGTYTHYSFWITAILFAAEHGSYWDVGLLAGIIYNWWMVRTGRLADCIVAHAVTNGLLAAFVLYSGQWQYWL
jgi:CAAX prenyl protease-like protein